MCFALAVPRSLERKLQRVVADETEYNGNVYLNCDVEQLSELAGEHLGEDVVMSPNFPVFVAIDRFGAGRALLDGHAGRWVPSQQLAAFSTQWKAIKGRAQLVHRAAGAIDRGQDARADIEAGIAAIDAALAAAKKRKLDLALLCVPA